MAGVRSIKNSVNRVYFSTHLVQLRRSLGFDEWEDVREQLVRVLWIGAVLDRAGKALWEEVRHQGECLADEAFHHDFAGCNR